MLSLRWFLTLTAVLSVSMPIAACVSPGAAQNATPTGVVGNVGYLEGRATIGPLTPVERADVPPPTPPPEICVAVELALFRADGTTEVASIHLRPDCTYQLALGPGSYVVRLRPASIVQFSKDLPRTVQIESGKTTRLDFSVDTGIR